MWKPIHIQKNIHIYRYIAHRTYNKEQLFNDCNSYIRRIKLRAHFGVGEYQPVIIETLEENNSVWMPNIVDPTVETSVTIFVSEISKKKTQENLKENLCKGKCQAPKTLSEDENIVITKADVGATVVWGCWKIHERSYDSAVEHWFLQKTWGRPHNRLQKDYWKFFERASQRQHDI